MDKNYPPEFDSIPDTVFTKDEVIGFIRKDRIGMEKRVAQTEPKPESPAELAAERERFEAEWGREQAQNDGTIIGADYKHWMRKGWLAAIATIQASASASQPVATITLSDGMDGESGACLKLIEWHARLGNGKHKLYTAATKARPASGEAWISVDDAKPTKFCDVWLVSSGAVWHGLWLQNDRKFVVSDIRGAYKDACGVTHWQPYVIPAAPTSTPSAAKKD